MLSTFTPTPQQQAVDQALALSQQHLLVVARAGTGKTTSMCWWIERILEREPRARILTVAFNRVIADELTARVPPSVRAQTFHSICLGACRRAAGADIADSKTQEIFKYWLDQCPAKPMDKLRAEREAKALLSLVYASRVDPSDHEQVQELADSYDRDIEIPELSLPLLESVVSTARRLTRSVTYECMIDHVLVHQYPLTRYDYVLVDEAQDLNEAFLRLLPQMLQPSGRLVAVADDRQAIYAFRGADRRSVETIRQRFKPAEFPLSVTFRCSRSIVDLARHIVPDYEAGPDNPEGRVDELPSDDCETTLCNAPSGSLVLCRNNAPLIRWCMWCLRRGIQAYIRGRNIGKELIRMLEQADSGDLQRTMETLRSRAQRKSARLRNQDREKAAEVLMDKVAALEELADSYDTVGQILNRISSTYRDKGQGLVFSTVHKAKGLESDTVVILGPELMPPRWIYRYRTDQPERFERLKHEEDNIRYVAITRARYRLVLQELPRD